VIPNSSRRFAMWLMICSFKVLVNRATGYNLDV
jgi:hypothetical protein